MLEFAQALSSAPISAENPASCAVLAKAQKFLSDFAVSWHGYNGAGESLSKSTSGVPFCLAGRRSKIILNARLATRQFLRGRHALMGFIRLLVRDSHAAEDIFQEVWMELIDAAERRKEIDDLPKWCRGVARNLAKRHWREKRHGRVVAGTELLDQIELAFAEAQQSEDHWHARQAALKDCISLLPERAQQLLRRRCEAGNTLVAIASELNRTVEAVTKSLSRIRETLRRCVERKLKVELQP